MSPIVIAGLCAVSLLAVMVLLVVCSRMNERGRSGDTTGSETGIESDRDLKSWEGWK